MPARLLQGLSPTKGPPDWRTESPRAGLLAGDVAGPVETPSAADADQITGAPGQASETFHGTKREAQRELARLVAQADAGGRSTGRVTFAQLLDRWWNRSRLSPTTARKYRRVTERRLQRDLGRRPFYKLTVVDLAAYYLRLERDERLAPASVRRIHAIVGGALGQAVKWDGWHRTRRATPRCRVRRGSASFPHQRRSYDSCSRSPRTTPSR